MFVYLLQVILLVWLLDVCKEITEGKKTGKEDMRQDIFYTLTLFLGSTTFCGWGNHSRIQMKWLHLPDKVLKCVSRFWADMPIIQCFQLLLLLLLLSLLYGSLVVILMSSLFGIFGHWSFIIETDLIWKNGESFSRWKYYCHSNVHLHHTQVSLKCGMVCFGFMAYQPL